MTEEFKQVISKVLDGFTVDDQRFAVSEQDRIVVQLECLYEEKNED